MDRDFTFIGIDGGGTKTALIAARSDCTGIRQMETSGSSWREHGVKNVAKLLAESVEKMGCGKIGGIVAGMPCFGESIEGDAALKNEIEAVFPSIPFYLTNDVEVGWAGAFALHRGIHLVAGTGSIAYGIDESGIPVRCGGWDEFYSDEGSAHWIARKGMELFSKQSDGRLPEDRLCAIIREKFSLSNDMDFIDHIHKHYSGSREKRAAFQMLVMQAAQAGDESAQAVYNDAAKELYEMSISVKRQLNMPSKGWRVSYSGGVFKTKELILEPLRALLEAAGGILIKPEFTPVKGALLMAIARYSSAGLTEPAKDLLRDE